jgi:hypothetical protein
MLGAQGKKHRRVVGDTAFLFWGDETAMEQVAEVLYEPIAEKTAKEKLLDAAEVFDSPFTGYASDQIAEVNVLGLTAAQARAAVSFWFPGRADEVSRNIHAWVEEVGFGPNCAWGEPMGKLLFRPTIGRMALLLTGKGNEEAASRQRGRVARSLALSVFQRRPVQHDLAHAAERLVLTKEWNGGWQNANLATLIGLLAVYELRKSNVDKEDLMNDNMYRLGQFYALVEKMEIDSLGARGSNVTKAPVSRHKKAIYRRPNWGFGHLDERFEIATNRLRRAAQIHYARVRTEIVAEMDASEFPLVSTENNLFLIGAAHKSKELWAKSVHQPEAAAD